MMNSGTMADMIMEAMQKKQGPKDTFNMRGGKASPVMYEEETSREFVMYEAPNGEEVKIYGSWNEFAVDRNAEGNDLIGDENFPVMRNKDGEYILDMQSYEDQKSESEIIEKGEGEEQAPEQPSNNMPPKMMYGGSIKRFR
tara:strand:- start:350 stop:772 length:423 start_codon:yes stop_codon:yes gene_type:complete